MKRPTDLLTAGVEVASVVLLLFCVSGCTVIHREIGAPLDPVPLRFQEGKTEVGDVLERLGPPGKVSALPGGFVFAYEQISSTERQIGLSSSRDDWLSWFKLAVAKATAERRVLLVEFDQRGILEFQGFEHHLEDLGQVVGMQFLFAVASVVDASHLEAEIGPHQWGSTLLRPLPETLNIPQSLDLGTRGLEQEGTPTAAGQHSPEWR